MKLNLKTVLKDLDGKEIPDGDGKLEVGRIISTMLANSKSEDPLRNYILAMKYREEKERDVDSSEEEFVKNVIKSTESWTPLVKGQLLMMMADCKPVDNSKKEDKKQV